MKVSKKQLIEFITSYPGALMCVVNHTVEPAIITWSDCGVRQLPVVARADWHINDGNWKNCVIITGETYDTLR